MLALATGVLLACGGEEDEYAVRSIAVRGPIEPNTRTSLVAQIERGSVCTLTIGEIQRTDRTDGPRTLPAQSPGSRGEVRFNFGVPLEAVPQEVVLTLNCNKDNQNATGQATLEITERITPLPTATPG